MEPFHFAIRMDMFHAILDLAGTFVFALSGGVSGVKHRLDIFACSCCPSRRPMPGGLHAT